MELALARIEMLYIEKDSINWEMFKNDCMEKEKEAIITAWNDSKISMMNGNQYYEETYNQKNNV